MRKIQLRIDSDTDIRCEFCEKDATVFHWSRAIGGTLIAQTCEADDERIESIRKLTANGTVKRSMVASHVWAMGLRRDED